MGKPRRQDKKQRSFASKLIISFVLVLMCGGAYVAYHYYQQVFGSNISLAKKQSPYFYISTGASYQKVVQQLFEQGYIINKESFDWVARKKNYPNKVKAGRYLLVDKMNNNELVNLLRSGDQAPVNVVFNNVRTLEELAGQVATYLEPDSIAFISTFNNPYLVDSLGFNRFSFPALFIPNTYEFYWNTSAKQFINRMALEYKKFWNADRKALCRKITLSQSQVSTLASIVKAETSKLAEARKVAGVYVNRLKRNIALQADPTLIWALKDFTITRVLNVHKQIDSPYNTYRNKGLPPGPINLPEPHYIDAVLNYESHNYIYFCAKEDFSGYHNFASTYAKHLKNARQYQRALNQRKIFR